MCKDKDHVFIRFLEFGLSKAEGFHSGDVETWLKEGDFKESEKTICRKFINELTIPKTLPEGSRLFISPEYYFNYIDYVELKEARKNSISAFKHSLVAIFLSGFAVFVSLVIGYYQITKPIDLSGKTINEISKVLDK
jgi:hypothetical protein